MLGKYIVNTFKRAFYINPEEYEIQDLVLIHMLHITLCLVGVSAISNPLLNLPPSVIFANLLSAILLSGIYYITRFQRKYSLGRKLYILFAFVLLNFLWFQTAGSSGPTLIYIVAFVPMVAFMLENKFHVYAYLAIGLNTTILLLLEAYSPSLITLYESDFYRVIDILSVAVIFFAFEIPLVIHTKNLVIKQRNKAQQSEKVKTSFVTHLSHEIRTPMNAIIGFSELLNQTDLPEEDRTQYITVINENCNSLLNLLNNIINISKIEEEQTKVSISTFNPQELLNRVHSTLSYMTHSGSVDLRVSPTNVSCELKSDITLLYQILINLTYNALKFTEKGFVDIGYSIDEDYLTYIIKDTGIGITKDKQQTIFNKFEQDYRNNTINNFNGSGLGLTICYMLSKLIRGKISFQSTENVGTTFYLKIPLCYS